MVGRYLGILCLLLAVGCGGESGSQADVSPGDQAAAGASDQAVAANTTQVSFKVPGMI